MRLVYWDSDPFLGWLQEEPEKVAACSGVVEEAENGEVLIVTSALTIAEVLYRRQKGQIPADKRQKVVAFFRNEYIAVRNVTRSIAEYARDLVWDHGIDPKDAIHVATALDGKVPVLQTFDGELINHTGRIGNPALIIQRPTPPKQGRFFP